MAKINGLTHCSFRTNHFDEMVHFYRDILELPHLFTLRNEDGSVWIEYLKVAPREFIELFNERYTGDNNWRNRAHQHICLMVEDIVEAARSLEAKGVMICHGPIMENPPYRIPYEIDHSRGKCNSYGFFVHDPEGNEIEFMQYTDESLQVVNDHD